jgi:drug/metabolite transporter (DMT)-like permease
MKTTPAKKAYLYLLLAAVIWGLAGPVIKTGLNTIPYDIFLSGRFLVSSLIAIPFLLRGKKYITRNNALPIFIYSLLTTPLTLGLLFLGTEKTSLLDMSLIQSIGPLVTVIFAYFFLNEHLSARRKLGIVIAYLGSFIIAVEPLFNGHKGTSALLGNIIIFLSLFANAASFIYLKKLLNNKIPPDLLAHLSFVVGFLVFLPITFSQHSVTNIFSGWVTHPWPILYMALFSGTLAYIFQNKAQQTLQVTESAVFAYLHPTISALLATMVLGDKLTPAILIGSGIILVGILASETQTKGNC